MKKIPTLFVRDAEDRRYVTGEVAPGCEWVLAGEGVATRKYDGTCMMRDEHGWWARREVKPGKQAPTSFVLVERDENTGKGIGWIPALESPFVKYFREAIEGKHGLPHGTYELVGPKINGNPERLDSHRLVSHENAERIPFFDPMPQTLDELAPTFALLEKNGIEGVVWHHPGGRMAKLKVKDFHTFDIALEVTFDAHRAKWIVRQLGGDPKKVFKVSATRRTAEYVAGGIATFIATFWNRPKRGHAVGTCEVHVRELDGTFGAASTYGYDPERSKG